MKIILSLLIGFWPAFMAAETAPAIKKELVFADDFSVPEMGKGWRMLWPGFSVSDGVLKASQTKPEHSAVAMAPVGKKDLVLDFKFRMGAATSINVVCNDRQYTEGHGGHICRVSLLPRQIFLGDDKERLSKKIEEMRRDPARKAEVDKLVVGRTASVPMKLDPARWYQMTIEIVSDEMRVSLDGRPVGFLKSSGIGHPTKTDFYFAVSGDGAAFDDLRIWEAGIADVK